MYEQFIKLARELLDTWWPHSPSVPPENLIKLGVTITPFGSESG